MIEGHGLPSAPTINWCDDYLGKNAEYRGEIPECWTICLVPLNARDPYEAKQIQTSFCMQPARF